MGYRKNPVLAFAFLCDLCAFDKLSRAGFAVKYLELLPVPHPQPEPGSDPQNRNELNRRKQKERRTEGLIISSLSKTSVSSC
jgi:hypothetical protein